MSPQPNKEQETSFHIHSPFIFSLLLSDSNVSWQTFIQASFRVKSDAKKKLGSDVPKIFYPSLIMYYIYICTKYLPGLPGSIPTCEFTFFSDPNLVAVFEVILLDETQIRSYANELTNSTSFSDKVAEPTTKANFGFLEMLVNNELSIFLFNF